MANTYPIDSSAIFRGLSGEDKAVLIRYFGVFLKEMAGRNCSTSSQRKFEWSLDGFSFEDSYSELISNEKDCWTITLSTSRGSSSHTKSVRIMWESIYS